MDQEGTPRLADLLKKKGIGPEGSKSLSQSELDLVNKWMVDTTTSTTTKATILTALLMLEPTLAEQAWISELNTSPALYLPAQLLPLLPQYNTPEPFTQLIKEVISKKDLNKWECSIAMGHLLDPAVAEHLKGPFLEAERLKRETFEENEGFLNYLWQKCTRIKSTLPVIIDIGDSYDGNNRTLQLSVFVAALLASAGFPCYVHGVEKVAPKEGITAHQVLKAANKNPFKSLADGLHDLENPDIGWTYVDQETFFPQLFALRRVRKEMVKRPFLATFEKVLQPIQSIKGNHLITGYTHLHYRTEMVKQLAHQKQCHKGMVVRGAEGSTGMSLSRDTVCVYYDGKEIEETLTNPIQYGIVPSTSSINKSLTLGNSLHEGVAALHGVKNAARESMLYSCMVIVCIFKLMDPATALSHFERCLDNGVALTHYNKGC